MSPTKDHIKSLYIEIISKAPQWILDSWQYLNTWQLRTWRPLALYYTNNLQTLIKLNTCFETAAQ